MISSETHPDVEEKQQRMFFLSLISPNVNMLYKV